MKVKAGPATVVRGKKTGSDLFRESQLRKWRRIKPGRPSLSNFQCLYP